MNNIELVILSIGLAMDATAVSLACSAIEQKAKKRVIVKAALFFGFFQAVMPLIGYTLGLTVKDLIQGVDHWIAFSLLSIVGGKMIIEKDENENKTVFDNKNLLILAIATSIDALVVGITFSLISVDLIKSVITIGLITFAFSLAAGMAGKKLNKINPQYLKIAGGVFIVLIGVKILIDHLMK